MYYEIIIFVIVISLFILFIRKKEKFQCPVNIDPLSIITDMRRYLVMEESAAPQELNMMMTNIENNGAPWQFNQQDRLNWANEE